MNLNLNRLGKIINEKKDIIITTHQNPDADGLGAAIGLFLALDKISKERDEDRRVRIIIDDRLPKNIEFLYGSEYVENYKNYDQGKSPDLIISLDAANLERIGGISEFSGKIPLINIDHHISNDAFGDYNYVNPEFASTCEIIFELLKTMEIQLDGNIASAIYAGIVNDTGNFSHTNVRKSTFQMAAELLEAGADNHIIVRELRNTKSLAAIRLMGKAMFTSEYISEKKIIYTLITQDDYSKYGGDKSDTDGVSEELLSCTDADVSLFIREEIGGSYKGSMRTKSENIDLNRVTGFFGGGGHRKAAGFSSALTPQEIVEKIMELL
ncbi:MAG: DHH family phosphoesterase [Fusobacteriaceae bacterium]